MNRIPTISIVTPCYNAAETLSETILSVVSQSGPFRIRYHVQDGGSADRTPDILAEWDKRLREGSFPLLCDGVEFTWASEPDDGMYDAINKGIAALEMDPNDIMGWFNADDTYSQHVFATALAIFDQNPDIRWVGGMNVLLDDAGCLHPTREFTYYPKELIQSGCCGSELWPHIQQGGMFWRYSLWTETGGLDTRFRFAGDWELWQRFSNVADFVHIRTVFGTFRFRADQLSQDDRYAREQEAHTTIDERCRSAKSFFATHLLPPPVLTVSPSDAREPGKRMKVLREVPRGAFTTFQTQRIRLWKNGLPSWLRKPLGAVRRGLQRLSGKRRRGV